MKYTARVGNIYHAFKKREAYIIRKLDGKKRPTQVHDRQDIPRHNDSNQQGRLWTF